MADYMCESRPICPHCGHELSDPWEVFSEMEQTVEVDCGSCEEVFSLTRSVTFHYAASKEQQP